MTRHARLMPGKRYTASIATSEALTLALTGCAQGNCLRGETAKLCVSCAARVTLLLCRATQLNAGRGVARKDIKPAE